MSAVPIRLDEPVSAEDGALLLLRCFPHQERLLTSLNDALNNNSAQSKNNNNPAPDEASSTPCWRRL